MELKYKNQMTMQYKQTINFKGINAINVKDDCRIYNKYPVLCKFWQ